MSSEQQVSENDEDPGDLKQQIEKMYRESIDNLEHCVGELPEDHSWRESLDHSYVVRVLTAMLTPVSMDLLDDIATTFMEYANARDMEEPIPEGLDQLQEAWMESVLSIIRKFQEMQGGELRDYCEIPSRIVSEAALRNVNNRPTHDLDAHYLAEKEKYSGMRVPGGKTAHMLARLKSMSEMCMDLYDNLCEQHAKEVQECQQQHQRLVERESLRSFQVPILTSRYPDGMKAGDVIVLSSSPKSAKDAIALRQFIPSYFLSKLASEGGQDYVGILFGSAGVTTVTTMRNSEEKSSLKLSTLDRRVWARAISGSYEDFQAVMDSLLVSLSPDLPDFVVIPEINAQYRRIRNQEVDGYANYPVFEDELGDVLTATKNLCRAAEEYKVAIVAGASLPVEIPEKSVSCKVIPASISSGGPGTSTNVRVGLNSIPFGN